MAGHRHNAITPTQNQMPLPLQQSRPCHEQGVARVTGRKPGAAWHAIGAKVTHQRSVFRNLCHGLKLIRSNDPNASVTNSTLRIANSAKASNVSEINV